MLPVNLEEAKDRLLEPVDAVLKGETVRIVKTLKKLFNWCLWPFLRVASSEVPTEGQVKFRGRDGREFVIRPERPAHTSPFEVRSVKLPASKNDILEVIRESRARFS